MYGTYIATLLGLALIERIIIPTVNLLGEDLACACPVLEKAQPV
jgi:hypothetical protein